LGNPNQNPNPNPHEHFISYFMEQCMCTSTPDPEWHNLKLLSVAPERIWKWGHRSWAKGGGGVPIWREASENFFWSCPSTFLAL